MAAIPMKPGYGPTLGRLLEPRWRRASRAQRAGVIALALTLAALAAAAVLTLENSVYSHGGTVPFSFSYRGLWRTPPERGGYVKLLRRHSDGSLRDSFAVGPLTLPPYSGSVSGELPMYADGYIRMLRSRFAGFVLRGEGKAKVNGMISAYDVFYIARVEGHRRYGRDILLLPEREGARRGVQIEMLTTPGKGPGQDAPIEVATNGVLFRPLKSFSFG